ncbi:coagulation factor IIIa [Clupea harengus]|uniref:Tissue factor n=1 Tax=Clupea harengus TaxID=7950 RepID=A0A6P8GLH0_CLUHA|nr:coagulation factor IIIa [Clupea harengus]
MYPRGKETIWALGFFTLLLLNTVTGSFPKAQNVSWSSINFKTLLLWSPKPDGYSYTVEFSRLGQNRDRSPHCIQTSETECDLTQQLKNLKHIRETYTAVVQSESARGVPSDIVEPPYTESKKFCPYTDTLIGKPDFNFTVSGRKITINVIDPLTALFNGQNQRMSIRDIFGDDLQYSVMYRRAGSTGKKRQTSATNVIELANVDKGESYCLMVQAAIPSRGLDKQYGELSHTKCTPDNNKGIFDEYGIGAIAGVIFTILAIIIIAIVVMVVCCKRRRKEKSGKEGIV